MEKNSSKLDTSTFLLSSPPVHSTPSARLRACVRARLAANGGSCTGWTLPLPASRPGPRAPGEDLLIHAEALRLLAIWCTRDPGQPGSARVQPLTIQSCPPNRHRPRPRTDRPTDSGHQATAGTRARKNAALLLPGVLNWIAGGKSSNHTLTSTDSAVVVGSGMQRCSAFSPSR